MLVVELAFTPAPERLAARPAHRAALARLHAGGELVAAGPWDDDSGALLVFALDRPRLEEVMREDPYYRRTPGVDVRSIREWAPIVGI
ncbi:YciI family protein [Streptomyces sp. MMG1533]|uniref:YciI family protein n=1 Tax=Streptomyces sp. MMG1533 TaxID=1415546 RepID=UPI0006AE1232|nr:YciI family protein [Streptomyces sp. MMG1533]